MLDGLRSAQLGVKRGVLLLISVALSALSVPAVFALDFPISIHRGNGLANTFAKLSSGEPATIAYIGGSITQRAGYRDNVSNWFRGQYPGKITEINAGWSSTGSLVGVMRLQRDVLAQQPDLIFVEFAVNDLVDDDINFLQRNYEGFPRQAWSQGPRIDVCYIETIAYWNEAAYLAGTYPVSVQATYNAADRYGCPSVNVGWALYEQVLAGTPWAPDLSADRVHPNATGSRIYSDAIIAYLQSERARAGAAADHVLPAPLTDFPVMGSTVQEMIALSPAPPPGWAYHQNEMGASSFIQSTAVGATLNIPFIGPQAAFKAILAVDGGNVSVSVDGGPFVAGKFYATSNPFIWATPAAKTASYGPHAMTVRVDSGVVRIINLETAATNLASYPPLIVESCAGAANFGRYYESPDASWADSAVKSTAAGVRPGIGSRVAGTDRTISGERHAVFAYTLPATGLYELFTAWGAGAGRQTPILHRITNGAVVTDVDVDQSALADAWVSLGTFSCTGGAASIVDVSNLSIDAPGSMYADAVKWEYRGTVRPPGILMHPADQQPPEGATANFGVSAVGDYPVTFRWQKDGADLTDGGKVSGAATTALQISDVGSGDQGNYRCVVTNPYGMAATNSAVLAIGPSFFIVESRAGGQNTAKYSETGTWSDASEKTAAAGATPGIGSRNGSTDRAAAGEKHAVFSGDFGASGSYEVFASWGPGTSRRSPILHRIMHANGVSDFDVDQAAIADVWVSLGTYTFASGPATGKVDVSNLNVNTPGAMYADAVKWEFRSPIPVPVITQAPYSVMLCPGGGATFTVVAAGQGALSYRWQRDGLELADGGPYVGTSTSTLTISSAGFAEAGSYRCVVTNAGGPTRSPAASLTLRAATAVTLQPTAQTSCPGRNVALSVGAVGDGTLGYRWQRSGFDIFDGSDYFGAGTPNLTIVNADAADSGTYRCIVTGGCGSAVSESVQVAIRAILPVDFNSDCDVDLNDLSEMLGCMSGPGNEPSVPCRSKDVTNDTYVDQSDFGVLQRCLSGPGVPPDQDCAD